MKEGEELGSGKIQHKEHKLIILKTFFKQAKSTVWARDFFLQRVFSVRQLTWTAGGRTILYSRLSVSTILNTGIPAEKHLFCSANLTMLQSWQVNTKLLHLNNLTI